MKVGWLTDPSSYTGGAELTQAEFRAAAPDGVEVIDCPPGKVEPGLDRYVVHNHLAYSDVDLEPVKGNAVRYCHDVRPQKLQDAEVVCCSPLQAERMGFEDAQHIPPALDLPVYKPPRQSRRHRKGICSIAAWQNPGKGQQLLAEWAAENGPVDVYGDGPFAPRGFNLELKGPLDPLKVAQTLWGYHTFVFLPTDFEPFGRCVMEAYAAKCQLVVNRNVGALHWLERPEAIESAAEDFWSIVCDG